MFWQFRSIEGKSRGGDGVCRKEYEVKLLVVERVWLRCRVYSVVVIEGTGCVYLSFSFLPFSDVNSNGQHPPIWALGLARVSALIGQNLPLIAT